MEQWSTAAEELEALRRSAFRASCTVRYAAQRDTPHGRRAVANVQCPDGWGAARFLLALSLEDARTAAARSIALELRSRTSSDEDFARAVFDYVKSRVRFVREPGEVFARSDYTLATGAGDCDDHARVAYALLCAGGLPVRLAFLYRKGDPGPRHVVAQAGVPGRGWVWLETTVDAFFGEHPYAAAARLGVTNDRSDIASEVRAMTEKDLAPVPAGFDGQTSAVQLAHDVARLKSLGFLCSAATVQAPSDPEFRRAVADFQRSRAWLALDGLIGPQTRSALGTMQGPPGLPADSSDITDGFLSDTLAMARRFQAQGATATAEDFLRVWFVESAGLQNVKNFAGEPFAGINQMGPQERKNAGFNGTIDDWIALSLEEQLPFVERFYVSAAAGQFRRFRDAASLYVANIAPALMAHADDPGFPLYRYRPEIPGIPALSAPAADWAAFNRTHSDPYAENRGLDRDKKGFISVGDMAGPLNSIARAPRWLAIQSRIVRMGGGSTPGASGSAVGTVVALLLLAGTVGGAWWLAGRA